MTANGLTPSERWNHMGSQLYHIAEKKKILKNYDDANYNADDDDDYIKKSDSRHEAAVCHSRQQEELRRPA